jgi:hypothetical protein
MNEFSKVAGYKTNINPVLFPYTNNKWSVKGIKKTFLFTITSKTLRSNKLSQVGERSVHCKLRYWWKKLKKTKINGKIADGHGLELILLKCPYFLIPIKILMAFFTKVEKAILKFLCNLRRPWIDKTMLRKNKAGGCQNTWFQNMWQSQTWYHKPIIPALLPQGGGLWVPPAWAT